MTPLDGVAGNAQPGTRHVPDPAPGSPSGRAARSGRPAVAPAPRGAAAGGNSSPRSSRERAVAEKPDPATGAASSSRAAPGRGRAQAPAGGTDTSTAPLAGSRTFTLELPAGMKMLSLNGREHWAERHRKTQALKQAAWALALSQKIPRLGRVSVVAEYQPGDLRRRDADNPVASVKAAIDGIVAAGCLPSDESPRYVTEVTCRIGTLYPKGRLVLYLTEIAEPPAGAA